MMKNSIIQKMFPLLLMLIISIVTYCEKNNPTSVDEADVHETFKIYDYQYLKNVYYFIDNAYRENYFLLDNGAHLYQVKRIVTDFDVYISSIENDPNGILGYAAADSSDMYNDFSISDQKEHVKGFWMLVDKSKYYLNPILGFIRFNNLINENQMVAIAYKDSSQRIYGDINFNVHSDSLIHLKLLKPQYPEPEDKTWDLMFKNIYYLGKKYLWYDNISISIVYNRTPHENEELMKIDNSQKYYLEIFGLDRVNENGDLTADNKIDFNSNNLHLNLGELEFPAYKPFNNLSNPFYNNLINDGKVVEAIYESNDQQQILQSSKFYIEVTFKK